MTTNTENLEQELTNLKKDMSKLKLLAKTLLENSKPCEDPMKQELYVCASCFIEPLLNKEEV